MQFYGNWYSWKIMNVIKKKLCIHNESYLLLTTLNPQLISEYKNMNYDSYHIKYNMCKKTSSLVNSFIHIVVKIMKINAISINTIYLHTVFWSTFLTNYTHSNLINSKTENITFLIFFCLHVICRLVQLRTLAGSWNILSSRRANT